MPQEYEWKQVSSSARLPGILPFEFEHGIALARAEMSDMSGITNLMRGIDEPEVPQPSAVAAHFAGCSYCQGRYARGLTLAHDEAVLDRVIER